MATTFFQFVPNVQTAFTFQPTLNRTQYTASVTWNLFSQRWYLTLTAANRSRVFTVPLIGSPDALIINSAEWELGRVTITTDPTRDYVDGQTVELTVRDCLPEEYNGRVSALVMNDHTFSYPVLVNPGPSTQLGRIVYDVNLIGGYIPNSTLVYRTSSQMFEVTP